MKREKLNHAACQPRPLQRLALIALASAALLASHCANPKTAEAYRKAAKDSMFAKVDNFVANDNYGHVTQILKKKTAECLNYAISRSGGGQVASTMTFTSTFMYNAKQGELVMKFQDVVHNIFGDTKGDEQFMLVADAKPIAGGKTQFDIYRGGGAAIVDAIKAWTNGDVRGCPDPARTFER